MSGERSRCSKNRTGDSQKLNTVVPALSCARGSLNRECQQSDGIVQLDRCMQFLPEEVEAEPPQRKFSEQPHARYRPGEGSVALHENARVKVASRADHEAEHTAAPRCCELQQTVGSLGWSVGG